MPDGDRPWLPEARRLVGLLMDARPDLAAATPDVLAEWALGWLGAGIDGWDWFGGTLAFAMLERVRDKVRADGERLIDALAEHEEASAAEVRRQVKLVLKDVMVKNATAVNKARNEGFRAAVQPELKIFPEDWEADRP